MVVIKVRLIYNKANERWDLRTHSGKAILDSQQQGIPDCERVELVFESPSMDEVNERVLVTLDPKAEYDKFSKIMRIARGEAEK